MVSLENRNSNVKIISTRRNQEFEKRIDGKKQKRVTVIRKWVGKLQKVTFSIKI